MLYSIFNIFLGLCPVFQATIGVTSSIDHLRINKNIPSSLVIKFTVGVNYTISG